MNQEFLAALVLGIPLLGMFIAVGMIINSVRKDQKAQARQRFIDADPEKFWQAKGTCTYPVGSKRCERVMFGFGDNSDDTKAVEDLKRLYQKHCTEDHKTVPQIKLLRIEVSALTKSEFLQRIGLA